MEEFKPYTKWEFMEEFKPYDWLQVHLDTRPVNNYEWNEYEKKLK